MNDSKQKNGLSSFSHEFTQALSGLGGVALVYNLVAHAVNSVSNAVSDNAEPLLEMFSTALAAPSFLGDLILVCVATGFVTYILLVLICSQEWVQETVEVEECWKKKKWWNPFHWVWAIVCTIKEVLKWVLKRICEWKEVIVTIAIITCIVAAVVAV